MQASVMLTSRKVGSFSTCPKFASCILSQICQNGKDLISAYWGI